MTSVEKLVKQKFGIASEAAFLELIASKQDAFYQENFFMDKAAYVANLKSLMAAINSDGRAYADALEAAKPGSIIESFAGSALGEIRHTYVKNRKILIQHTTFFTKPK